MGPVSWRADAGREDEWETTRHCQPYCTASPYAINSRVAVYNRIAQFEAGVFH